MNDAATVSHDVIAALWGAWLALWLAAALNVKRTQWRERVAAYEAAGVQHVMVHPRDREVDDWHTVIEGVGNLI